MQYCNLKKRTIIIALQLICNELSVHAEQNVAKLMLNAGIVYWYDINFQIIVYFQLMKYGGRFIRLSRSSFSNIETQPILRPIFQQRLKY